MGIITHEEFAANIQELSTGINTEKIAVAVSGGADSLCLAYLAHHWGANNNVEIIGIVVDHKLRPESADEAVYTKQLLTQYGMETHILTWEGAKPESNIQQVAREARYSLLADFCKNNNISLLLTAHNRNDQAETVLLRAFRGSGVDGLGGIPAFNTIKGILVARPLLSYTRSRIEQTLSDIGWQWVNDPSNHNAKYNRVKIRQLIKAQEDSELIVDRLNLLAHNMQRAGKFLDEQTNKFLKAELQFSKFGIASVSGDALIQADDEIAYRALVKILNMVSGHEIPPRFESLQLLYERVKNNKMQGCTLWGCEIKLSQDKVIFYRELAAVEPFKKVSPGQDIIWDNRYIINTRQSGLYIGALGKEGYHLLKPYLNHANTLLKAPVLYTTPMIYTHDRIPVYYPLLAINLQTKPIESVKLFHVKQFLPNLNV